MKKKHIINILIILAISIFITFLFDIIIGGGSADLHALSLNILYGFIIGGSISLSGFITHIILKMSDIKKHPFSTYTILLISIFIYISADVIVVNTIWYSVTHSMTLTDIFTNDSIIVSSIITIFIGLTIFFIILSKIFMARLLDAAKDAQHNKEEADYARYKTLKSQINPHFLFNSLNSLSSLIHIDTDKADEFVVKLSSIYRYVLDHQDDELVTLNDEIAFVKKYASLQSVRFDNNFVIDIKDIDEFKDMMIIPMSIQLVLENVFKHNIISKAIIITITICISDNYIVIKNNKNLKTNVGVSHNVGLSNIINRYKIISDKKCLVEDGETDFVVKLPLISDGTQVF